MKRPIALFLVVAGSLLAVACQQPSSPSTQTAPVQDGWVMPPIIDTVTTDGAGLLVQGQAAPAGRVVVTGPGGPAYAAGADDEGRFEVRIPRPDRDTLFVVEARVGQVGYQAPYRLLAGADPAGPIGLVTIGAPTQRLDRGTGLDAIDSDGRSTVLSGRAPPGSDVVVQSPGPQTVTAAPDGRWTLSTAGNGVSSVIVDDVVFSPPTAPANTEGVLERTPGGWRIGWASPGGGRQVTWFPDAR